MTTVETIDLVEQPTAVIHQQVPMAELPAFIGQAFAAVIAELGRQGIAPVGPPFACYHGEPGQTVDVEAGFPAVAEIAAAGDVVPGRLPGGSALRCVHVGPYETLRTTYDELFEQARAGGRTLAREMWETYLSDPAAEPDPSTWRTEITWPLD